MNYEPVIGLEVHVQLKTCTKMFARAPYRYGEPPNTLVDPVVLGLPGTLPVMNAEAVRQTIRVGLLLGCRIAEVCKWDRKNYFYPDIPKNYQISQYDQPLCLGGSVEIELPGASRNVMGEHKVIGLTRIHLEEDVGKLTHFDNDSLVDYNRAGTPLIEIVSEPDLRSPDECFAYLTALRAALIAAGVSECDMEKGQLRCDANVSVRPVGQQEFGTKIEIKNLNSISGVRNGVEYEIRRQTAELQAGRTMRQETRRWDAALGVTQAMRSKEQAHDYRYFPDPDLMPVRVTAETLTELKATLPELWFDLQRRFVEQYDLPYTLTAVLCPDQTLAAYFEEAVRAGGAPRAVANWIANDLLRELSAAGTNGAKPISESPVRPAQIAALTKLVDGGAISSQIAKEVFLEMFQSGKDPETIVDAKGLRQSTDTGEIERQCVEAIAANPKAVEQFKGGKDGAINAIKGAVMKASRGSANPKLVDEILRRLLS